MKNSLKQKIFHYTGRNESLKCKINSSGQIWVAALEEAVYVGAFW